MAKNIDMKMDNKFFDKLELEIKLKGDKYMVILQHPVTTEIMSTKAQIDKQLNR